MLRLCLYYDMCPSLLGHGSSLQPADRPIDQYVRTRSRLEWKRYVGFNQVGPDCQALPCVRRCSWWVPAVRGELFFSCNMDALPCVQRCSWWVPAVRGEFFFTKYNGPSGGSLLSGGGIIIFRVIRRHFLAAAATKKYTSVMIRVCDSRLLFLSCMYIHDKFMTESR